LNVKQVKPDPSSTMRDSRKVTTAIVRGYERLVGVNNTIYFVSDDGSVYALK